MAVITEHWLWPFELSKLDMIFLGFRGAGVANRRLLEDSTSAYHLQSNGLTERFNQTLQMSLLKVVNDTQSDWDDHLYTCHPLCVLHQCAKGNKN